MCHCCSAGGGNCYDDDAVAEVGTKVCKEAGEDGSTLQASSTPLHFPGIDALLPELRVLGVSPRRLFGASFPVISAVLVVRVNRPPTTVLVMTTTSVAMISAAPSIPPPPMLLFHQMIDVSGCAAAILR